MPFRHVLCPPNRRALAQQVVPFRIEWVIGFFALHILLGILCKQSRWLAATHALATLVVGLYLVATRRDLFNIACWGAYVVGAEVLWRMAQAPVPWEYGKYAISFVFLITFFGSRRGPVPWIPIMYFLLLIPAIFSTLTEFPLQEVRGPLSFNLSGPLSITVCALFLSQVRLDDHQLRRMMVCLIIPVTAIAGAVLFGLSTTEVEFRSGSNFAASGGFGPNQVSAILGLGALFGLLLALQPGNYAKLRFPFLLVGLWFAAHAALSFSRSGVYLLAFGLLGSLPFLRWESLLRPRTILLITFGILTSVGTWGYLVHLSEGKIAERFSRTELTGRDRIALADLQIWKENPLLGAGVGMSSYRRAEITGRRVAAHTEYSRLLAEHGLFGVMAGICLLVVITRPLAGSLSGFSKAVIIAGVIWALLSLFVSSMRTAAPAFLIGLGYLQTAIPRETRQVKKTPVSLSTVQPVIRTRGMKSLYSR